jgi:hypothetical protein
LRGPISLPIVLLAALVVAPARAADTGITGQKLVLKTRGSTQKLLFSSKDPLMPFPPIGSADDPSVVGASLDVLTPTQSGSMPIFGPLGNPGWSASDRAVDSYTYKNPSAPAGPSPIRSMTLKQGRTLKITARGVPLAMTAPLGSVGIRLVMGTTRACALFDASTVVADAPGSFTARNAAVRPVDCSDPSLGAPSRCGDGVATAGEECESTDDAACPGSCTPECTCAVPCDDGELDPGEECDGAAFSSAPACTVEPFLASPRCLPDCTCCQTLACSGPGFNLPCCPGLACPVRVGPNQITYCRPSCRTSDDCAAGQFCLDDFCRTPTCTSNEQCPNTPFGQSVCLGVCCVSSPFGLVCDG